MKNLFKSAFFTFFKSRVSTVLLAVLMFLSTSTFTILSSSSQALSNSYKSVVSKGKLHDFTVKQKYSINGQLALKTTFHHQETSQVYFTVAFDKVGSTGSYIENISPKTYAELILSEFKPLAARDISLQKPLYRITNKDLKFDANTFAKMDARGKADAITKASLVSLHLDKVRKRVDQHIHNNFENDFRTTVNNEYKAVLESTSVHSITIGSGSNLYKIVNGAQRPGDVNNLVLFSGSKVPSPMEEEDLKYEANKRLLKLKGPGRTVTDQANVHEGYKAIAYYDDTNGVTLSPYTYTDPSSLMAVVSPSFAKENKLKVIAPSQVAKIYETSLASSKLQDPFDLMKKEIKQNYRDQVVWVDSTPYFVVGVGTTPDFSFPIINQNHPIPDITSQAIIFTNRNGYKRIVDAFRNHPQENYLAYRFAKPVSKSKQKQIKGFIENVAVKKMAWGKNVDHIVSDRYDTSEKVIMAQHRISTIHNLNVTINAVTYVTLILLILFVAFVVVLVIKRQINASKRTFGILLATGYSKSKIAFANTSIALIIGSLSTIFGYIIGISFQWAFILIFKNYWTIPIAEISFSILDLGLTVLIPIVGVSLLAFFVTLVSINGSIANLISGGSSLSRNLNARFVAPFRWIGIRNRTSLALFFTNLPKMFLVFLSVTGSTIAIANALSIYNKFDIAKQQSSASTNYEYKIDLATPTTQGGLMKKMAIEQIGIGNIPDAKTIYSPNVKANNLFANSIAPEYHGKSKFMVPNLNDKDNRKSPFYLDGIVQVKSLLNVFAGVDNFGVGPWQVAEKIMPENQFNQANLQYQQFINFASKLEANNEVQEKNQKSLTQTLLDIGYLSKDNNKRYLVQPINFKKINSIGLKSFSNPSFTPMHYNVLKRFIFNGLRAVVKIYNDPVTPNDKKLANMPFFLSYRNIITNADDETFTRIEGEASLGESGETTGLQSLHIIGVKPTTRFINFSKQALEDLVQANNRQFLPVIANRFFLFRYKKDVGNVFDYKITNHKDRFSTGNKPRTIKVKIVGIHNSYASSKLYTLQHDAVKILGWDPQDKQEALMFNGLFTSHKNSIIFKSISLYSLSGLYPAAGIIVKNTEIARNIEKHLHSNPVAGASDLNAFERKFTLSPYLMAYKDVSWRYTNEHRFDSLADISSKLIYIIQGITIVLAVLFILIIALMILSNSKQFISTLRVLGYRQREISRIFFMAFMPTLVLGFFVAAPISFGISEAVQITIASFSEMYIPISLTWWTLIISTFITIFILGTVYLMVARNLQKAPISKAFE